MEKFLENSLSFYNKLTKKQKDLLKHNTHKYEFKQSEFLNHDRNECKGVEIIVSGQARVYISSLHGSQITLYRLFDNDVCILSAGCMLKNLDIPIEIEFEKDTVMYVIDNYIFKKICDENIHVKEFVLSELAMKFSDVMWLFNQYVFSNNANRLAEVLLHHMSIQDGLDLKITHEVIANDMGTAREVVTRLLKQFQKDGIVKLGRGKIAITNLEELKKI